MTLFSPLWSHFRVIMSGLCLRSLTECPRGQWWNPTEVEVLLYLLSQVSEEICLTCYFGKTLGRFCCFVFNNILLSFVCLQITCLIICSRIILGFEIRQTLCLPPTYFQEPCPRLSRYLLASWGCFPSLFAEMDCVLYLINIQSLALLVKVNAKEAGTL